MSQSDENLTFSRRLIFARELLTEAVKELRVT